MCWICIDKVLTIWHNVSMDAIVKYYEIHTVNGLTFRFKLDFNPISKEYEPHIWHRHQIEPETVVSAYMNITDVYYNSLRKRYESYSETEDLNIYYNYYSKDKTKIMIITAFKL